ncbi:hypothetical protein D3C87_1195280 [compost metagenome]
MGQLLRLGIALARVRRGRRADLGDAINRIAICTEVHANHRGQLGCVGTHDGLDRLRRQAVCLGTRDRHSLAEAGGAVGFLQRLELGFAILAGQFGSLLGDVGLAHLSFHVLELARGGRAVVDDPCRHQRGRAHLHRFGVALVLERIVAEQGLEHLFVVERVLRAQRQVRRAGHIVGGLDRQLELVGGRLEAF